MCPGMGPPPRVEKAAHRVAVPEAGNRNPLTLPVDRTPFQMQKKQTSQTRRRQSARSHFRAPGLSIPEDRLSTLRLWEKEQEVRVWEPLGSKISMGKVLGSVSGAMTK